ncbi:NAD(P)/FAD-dependent oxidoreductase [Halopiger djelfimassiliensis]|uniref:NAD(P)/FAD-dependent oxidoreductase n=1 Tax=Halopiger djelfimassiliensis TaxID=1293047 RepID=UPI000677FF1E|nr:FAD-dependent oxidoreductase [Halopiger djelfimassiliensis]
MDIVIVGGGIIGTAIAARLGGTDHDVTLVERSRIGEETTAASAGILMETAVDPTPFDLRFRERARESYAELFDRSSIETTRVGTLYVAETPAFADRLEDSTEPLRANGVEASFLPAAEFERFGVDPEGFVGGLYTPGDELCEPTAVAQWFAECARANGATVRTGVTVTDIRTDGRDGIAVSGVETDAGRLEADCVINAAGPWATELNEMVGVSLPLCHTLGPMAALEADDPIEGPVTILESHRYVRPTDGPGVWVGEYLTEYVDGQRYDPSAETVSDEFLETASDVAEIVPALEGATVEDDWLGLRTVTPDGRPLVGETTVDGFVVACGLTGRGITLAPAVADAVAETLAGTVDDETRSRLSPERF